MFGYLFFLKGVNDWVQSFWQKPVWCLGKYLKEVFNAMGSKPYHTPYQSTIALEPFSNKKRYVHKLSILKHC